MASTSSNKIDEINYIREDYIKLWDIKKDYSILSFLLLQMLMGNQFQIWLINNFICSIKLLINFKHIVYNLYILGLFRYLDFITLMSFLVL